MAVVFLGVQLMCRPPAPDSRAATEILGTIRKLNKDFAASADGSSIVQKVKSESSALSRKLDAAEPPDAQTRVANQDMRYEAEVLALDLELKQAIRNKEFFTAQMAFQSLDPRKGSLGKMAVWTKPYPVAPTKEVPRQQVSLSELYKDLRTETERLAKDYPVWGFMPGWQLLDALVRMTGAVPWFSYAFAALLLAVLVRGVVWPLAQRQYMWSRQMQQLQPLVKELKDKYQGQELNMKVMELYQQYGISPMAGCGPMLLQMPLFFLIYQCMLMYRFEFEKGTFLWIGPSGSSAMPGIIAPNLGERDYILLVIYGASMIVTQFLSPVSDPANARQQRIMGMAITVLFTVVMFTPVFPVPSAFVLYWIFTNLIATFQMLRAYRMPLPPLQKVQTKEGGVIARNPVLRAMQAEQEKRSEAKPSTPTNGQAKATGAPKLHKPKKKKK